MLERLMKPTEVTKLLAVSRSTLHRWIKQGELKAVKLPGGHLRISEEEVERLKAEQTGEQKSLPQSGN